MIKKEISEDGRRLVKTVSDRNVMLVRGDGKVFAEAVDSLDAVRDYEETDMPIELPEADESDKDAALRRFGMEV